jgi:hypothetical protein
MSAVIAAVSTPSTRAGTIHDVISECVFTCSLHLQRFKTSADVPRSIRRVSRMQPVGAAAVVQVADINKGTFTHTCHSAMSLLVIGFTYLEGRDWEIIVKELAAADSHSNMVSSYVFKRPTVWRKYLCLTPEWTRLLTTGVTVMMVMYHIQNRRLCYIVRHHLHLQFISVLIDRKISDITQLGNPQIADISLPAIRCTFAFHKSKHVCALRSTFSLAQCLNVYTLSLR